MKKVWQVFYIEGIVRGEEGFHVTVLYCDVGMGGKRGGLAA